MHHHPDQNQWEHPVPVAEEVAGLVVAEAEDDNQPYIIVRACQK
jgi:hypothetical protein